MTSHPPPTEARFKAYWIALAVCWVLVCIGLLGGGSIANLTAPIIATVLLMKYERDASDRRDAADRLRDEHP